jgi:hypothetical protein
MTEQEAYEWLLEQRLLNEAGQLEPDKIRNLNAEIPGWDQPVSDQEGGYVINCDNPALHRAFETWWNATGMPGAPLTFQAIRTAARHNIDLRTKRDHASLISSREHNSAAETGTGPAKLTIRTNRKHGEADLIFRPASANRMEHLHGTVIPEVDGVRVKRGVKDSVVAIRRRDFPDVVQRLAAYYESIGIQVTIE